MTPDKILAEYQRDLNNCINIYSGKWVRHRKNRSCIGPGLVENVSMSLRQAVCTIRWADNKITKETERDLEIIPQGDIYENRPNPGRN